MKVSNVPSNVGVVVSVRGSVVDVRFDTLLPPIHSVLRTGAENQIVIEVLAQRDTHHVRGIALTPTQGLARGTLARNIVDGAREVHLFGEKVPVCARIHTIGGFSAHADRDELLAWHRQMENPARTFLVHGEESAMQSFARQLHDTEVIMPKLHEAFTL